MDGKLDRLGPVEVLQRSSHHKYHYHHNKFKRDRETDDIDASGIDAAVKAMSEVGPMSGPDAHPEKRVRGE